MAINTRAYIENYLQIRTKEGKVVPFRLNLPQEKLYDAMAQQYREGKPMRAIVLKARQMGFSTLTEAMIFKRTATRFNANSGIVAHQSDATSNLFKMSKLFYDRLVPEMKPEKKHKNGAILEFNNQAGTGLNSQIRCMTAGGEGIGRSDTFQNLHLSEYAWWPGDKEDTLLGLLQAVPKLPDTMVVIESTANGFDDFKKRWDDAVSGRSEYAAVFCGWNEMPEYRTAYTGFELTEEESTLREQYGLDLEQIAWRRRCLADDCGGDLDKFRQEYPICPEEAFIASGSCYFDKEAVLQAMSAVQEPLERGVMRYRTHGSEDVGYWIDSIAFSPEKKGCVSIFEHPQEGVPYVLGADTAGDGSDWFVGYVVNNATGQQAAMLRMQQGEDEFTLQVMALGRWYNDALLAPEANYSTYPVKTMERFGYPMLYTREVPDEYTGRLQRKHGFMTSSATRPLILAEMQEFVRHNIACIRDKTLLEEMLVFVKNARGRPEAMVGEHDDCVMAFAITLHIRPQQAYTVQEVREEDADERFFEDEDAEFLSYGMEDEF